MRLLIIGALNGQIGAASQIAVSRGAKVSQSDTVDAGLNALRAGQGADLIMLDTSLDIALLVSQLDSELINVPVIACGIEADAKSAVAAIKAGAQEYIPLPPDAELIAAVLEAVTEDNHTIVHKDPKMAQALKVAAQIADSNASILVVGDSGTGKELLAHYIHRKTPPFHSTVCSCELCGHSGKSPRI